MSSPAAPATGSGPTGAPAEGPVGVVIVDDQPPFRSVARAVVGTVPGWRVLGEADSGEAGVDLVQRLAPQVVLMDVNMPGIGGIEATRRITRARPATVVVLISTYALEDLPPDAATCGAAGYARKDTLGPDMLMSVLPPAGP